MERLMRFILIVSAFFIIGCQSTARGENHVQSDVIDITELDSHHVDGHVEVCFSGSLFSIHRFSNDDNFIGPQGYEHVQVLDEAGELIFGDPLSPAPHVFRTRAPFEINGWLAAVRPRVLINRDEAPLTDRPQPVTVCGDLEVDDQRVLGGRTYEYRLRNWRILSPGANG